MIDNKKDAQKHEYGASSRPARPQQNEWEARSFSRGRPRMIAAQMLRWDTQRARCGGHITEWTCGLGFFQRRSSSFILVKEAVFKNKQAGKGDGGKLRVGLDLQAIEGQIRR
jgi:hypothetical protein